MVFVISKEKGIKVKDTKCLGIDKSIYILMAKTFVDKVELVFLMIKLPFLVPPLSYSTSLSLSLFQFNPIHFSKK